MAGRRRGAVLIADWSVEAAHDSPVITLPWEGWVDLHWDLAASEVAKTGAPPALAGAAAPWPRTRAASLLEVRSYPELLPLLQAANQGATRTAKVDVFPVSREAVDPEIAEAGLWETACGLGSYLDLLAVASEDVLSSPADGASTRTAAQHRSGGLLHTQSRFALADFSAYEQVARTTARALQAHRLTGACAEVVVRPARLYDEQGFGWTLYAMGFNHDPASARFTWARAATLLLETCLASLRDVLPKPPRSAPGAADTHGMGE